MQGPRLSLLLFTACPAIWAQLAPTQVKLVYTRYNCVVLQHHHKALAAEPGARATLAAVGGQQIACCNRHTVECLLWAGTLHAPCAFRRQTQLGCTQVLRFVPTCCRCQAHPASNAKMGRTQHKAKIGSPAQYVPSSTKRSQQPAALLQCSTVKMHNRVVNAKQGDQLLLVNLYR